MKRLIWARSARPSRWILGILLALFVASPLSAATQAANADDEDGTSTETKSYESPRNFGLDIVFASSSFPNYLYDGSTTSQSASSGFRLAFEWLLLQKYGKAGVGFGVGMSVLSNVQVSGPTADYAEGTFATLYAFPLEVDATYRFEYWENQFLVPFVRLGGGVTLTKQNSNYNGLSKDGVGTFGNLLFGGGAELNLNVLEKSAAKDLDNSIGINATYLTVEGLRYAALGSANQPDMTRTEIRAGLRFEF